MDSTELADLLTEPVGTVGMSYYFSPQAAARGETLGIDRFTFYAAGRGGVLGDRPVVEVGEAFFFFKPGMIGPMVEKGRAVVSSQVAASAHLDAASDFALATFGDVDIETLEAFSEAARTLAASLPRGKWPLVDGYLSMDAPSDPIAEAYYWSVVLRELRGAVHIAAVLAAGLTAAQACQLDKGGAFFEIHGYGDDDRTEITEELTGTRAAAERDTTKRMAALFDVLSDSQRSALAAGATLLHKTITAPAA